MPGPTESQVRTFVANLRQRAREVRVVGIRADQWAGPDRIDIDSTPYRVAFCVSPLHIREELLEANGTGLIVLTPLADDDLGGDVLARLVKRRVHTIDPWRVVQDQFGATRLDPRIRRMTWLAEALVEGTPPGGYSATATGILDADTAWQEVLRLRLGLSDGRPDVVALLRWAEQPGAVKAYLALPPGSRQDVRDRVRETAGPAGQAVLDAIELVPGMDVVALGLACAVLFHRDAGEALRDAAVRFERYHRQGALPREACTQWADAAERVLREIELEQGEAKARARAERADRFVIELGGETGLHLAHASPSGLTQRLKLFAAALDSARTSASGLAGADEAARYVLKHRLALKDSFEGRRRRIEMSLRLVRWMHATGPQDLDELADATDLYCREGAFADLARLSLLGGEQPEELGRAYLALLSDARSLRERQNEGFGRLVASSGATPVSPAIIPIERVIDGVLAPIASRSPVLFLVMDGLSRSVFYELVEGILAEGGRLWRPDAGESGTREWGAFATLPSITEVSRTSLFSGRVVRGDARDEKRAFSAHPALTRVSRSGRPPIVFHKGDLLDTSGRGLSLEVGSAIAASDQQIVGVVLNVVDDLLFKADQIQPRWTLETAPLLRNIMLVARQAGRCVLLTSDHGHLLDDDTAFQGREAGERWRSDDGPLQEGEIRVESRRVLAGDRSSITVPWSERNRYGAKRNGYHGGATPQELILPLALISWTDERPDGFVEAPLVQPSWWTGGTSDVEARQVARPPVVARPQAARSLLDVIDEPRVPAPVMADPAWIAELLASARYLEQRSRFQGRGAPTDDEVRKVLNALSARGGKMTQVALAVSIGRPQPRLAGLLAAIRRLLNVDGLQVIDTHLVSDTVSLDRELLLKQFEVAAR